MPSLTDPNVALTGLFSAGITVEMTRQLHTTRDRSRFAAWALLIGLLLGQLGLGPGVVAAGLGGATDDCDEPCPCEALAAAEDRHDPQEHPCSDEGPGEECPPNCDECACCAGIAVAVAPSSVSGPESSAGASTIAPREASAVGVTDRIFIPPELLAA